MRQRRRIARVNRRARKLGQEPFIYWSRQWLRELKKLGTGKGENR